MIDDRTPQRALEVAARRAAFARGFRELLPFALGVIAWGLVTGVAMIEAGLTVPQALGMTLAVYAGSAQLAALPLIAGAAPVWLVVLTAVVVNLRFVIYALALRSGFARLPLLGRIGLGYLIGDVTFVKYMSLRDREPRLAHGAHYFAGAAICNWLAWQAGSIAGIFAAGLVPRDAGLGLAGTLALVALVVPLCRRFPALAAVTTAGLVAVLARGVPLRLGLLAAVIAGIVVALIVERSRTTGSLRA